MVASLNEWEELTVRMCWGVQGWVILDCVDARLTGLGWWIVLCLEGTVWFVVVSVSAAMAT